MTAHSISHNYILKQLFWEEAPDQARIKLFLKTAVVSSMTESLPGSK